MMSENGGVPKNNKNINNQTYPPPWIGAEEGDREDCGKTHVRGKIFFTRGPWAENIQYLMRNFLMVVGMHWWLSRCGRIFFRLETSLWIFSGGKEEIFGYKGERTKEGGGRCWKCDRRAVNMYSSTIVR